MLATRPKPGEDGAVPTDKPRPGQVASAHESQGIAAALADIALACTDEADWLRWFETIETHWALDLTATRTTLASILGGTLVEAMRLIKWQRGQAVYPAESETALLDHLGLEHWPNRPSLMHDPVAAEHAQALCDQFQLGGLACWGGQLPMARQRLAELQMALNGLAVATGQQNSNIGRGELVIVLGGDTRVARVDGNRLELPEHGQGLARGWCQWRLDSVQERIGEAEREWRTFVWTGARGQMERQRAFLAMTQQALRALAASLVDRGSAGELALRRYRAAGKWMDDINQGNKDSTTLMRNWRKIKTGNRIAWSGLTGGEHQGDRRLRATIDNWQWEDRALEAAFWRAPQWQVPAWFQRFMALGSESWPENMNEGRGPLLMAAWAFAFEGRVRERLGHDSGAARHRTSHPQGQEAYQMERFFRDHLDPLLYGN
jgi:hypothetical protein